MSRDAYDLIAEEYDDKIHTGYREKIQDSIIFHHLDQLLNRRKLQILDAGGGTGHYSLPYAVKGHNVTILDKSRSMLKVAEAKAVKLGITENMRLMHGDMQESGLMDASFDAVFCHLALCHVEDPLKALSEFSRILREDGLLSLIVENKAFFAVSSVFRGNIAEAVEKIGEKKLVIELEGLGRVKTFERSELICMLKCVGLEPFRVVGLRAVCDYLYVVNRKAPEDLDSLRELELILSEDPSWSSVARFHFLLCQKGINSYDSPKNDPLYLTHSTTT